MIQDRYPLKEWSLDYDMCALPRKNEYQTSMLSELQCCRTDLQLDPGAASMEFLLDPSACENRGSLWAHDFMIPTNSPISTAFSTRNWQARTNRSGYSSSDSTPDPLIPPHISTFRGIFEMIETS